MTPEQQRIAIAEFCGWKRKGKNKIWINPNLGGGFDYLSGLPDYLNDLNAMHEAEKLILRCLSHLDYWQCGYGRFQTILAELTITPYSATAAQRAEALLKTIGKWEETK